MPSESDATKPCVHCAEPIRQAASVCPYCRRLQPNRLWVEQLKAFLFFVPFLMVFSAGIFWMKTMFGPGRDFGPYKAQIVPFALEMHFSMATNGNYISTMGHLRNDSPYAWKEIQLEVQYFNKDGKLIDLRSESRYGDTLPAGATHGFRVRGPADKPESQYVSQKVFVRSAKDSRRWP